MNEAIRTLLNNEPQALKSLNEVFHLDYNKPYQAFTIEGNTTIKQILKRIEQPTNKLILVLNYQGVNACFKNRYRIGIIDSLEGVEVKYNPHYFHANKLDCYYSKGDFRDDLKDRDNVPYHIIIAQDKELLTEIKKQDIDYSNR